MPIWKVRGNLNSLKEEYKQAYTQYENPPYVSVEDEDKEGGDDDQPANPEGQSKEDDQHLGPVETPHNLENIREFQAKRANILL